MIESIKNSLNNLIGALVLVIVVILVFSANAMGFSKTRGLQKSLFRKPARITSEISGITNFAVSADGKAIVYCAKRDEFKDLWIGSVDPGSPVFPRRLTNDSFEEDFPALSPDNKWLAYTGYGNDIKGDIYLLDLTQPGSKPKRLTGRASGDREPCFSPDGKTIYFNEVMDGTGLGRIVSTRLRKKTKPVETKAMGRFPRVSPDGKWLAYVDFSHHSGGDIAIMELGKKGKKIFITEGRYLDSFPEWSENGKRIYFSRISDDTNNDGKIDEKDNSAIYMVDAEAGKGIPVPLTRLDFSAGRPIARKGLVYFTMKQGGQANCFRLPEEGMIPGMGSAGAQLDIAFKISRKIPHDPYLSILSFYSVFMNYPEDREESAKAFYRAGLLYKDLGFNESAVDCFSIVRSGYSGYQPEASLAEINMVAMETREMLGSEDDPRKRGETLAQAIEQLRRAGGIKAPKVFAVSRIEIARLIFQEAQGAEGLMDAVQNLEIVIRDKEISGNQRAEAMVLLGDIYSKIGRTNEVSSIYLEVIKKFSRESPWAETAVERILDISTQASRGKSLKARIGPLVKLALQRSKDFPILAMGALNRAGDLCYEDSRWGRAGKFYQEVLNKFPIISTMTAAARFSLAEIYFHQQQFRKALDMYSKEINLRPREDHIRELAKTGYIKKSISSGEYLLRQGEILAARSRFKELIDYDYSIIEAHRGYIKCAAAFHDIPRVLGIYNGKLGENPNDLIAIYCKALCLTYFEDKKSLNKARALLSRAIELNGQEKYFYQTMGYVLEVLETAFHEKGTLEKALESYKRAYSLNNRSKNPENSADLLLNMGNAAYYLGKFTKALNYYELRLDSGAPFDSQEAEALFLRRLGESAFQTGKDFRAVTSYEKALDLIRKMVDPAGVVKSFDRLHRWINDHVISHSTETGEDGSLAGKLGKVQSGIYKKFSEISTNMGMPPSKEWKRFKAGAEGLLEKEKELLPTIKAVYQEKMERSRAGEKWKETFTIDLLRMEKAIKEPERLVLLEADTMDRLGLALQMDGKWKRAEVVFKDLVHLNTKLGLLQNTGPNLRSLAYTQYMQAKEKSGEKRNQILNLSLENFKKAISSVIKHGVAQKNTKTENGLFTLSLEAAFDKKSSTKAAHGFSKSQEIRLCRTFISRIYLELHQPVQGRKILEQELLEYPSGKKIAEEDQYGVSLLFHRAGLVASSLGEDKKAFDDFTRSAELTISMGRPSSSALNLENMIKMAAMESRDKMRPMLALLKKLDRKVENLLDKNQDIIGFMTIGRYHNIMGAYYLALSDSHAPGVGAGVKNVQFIVDAASHFIKGIQSFTKPRVITDRKARSVACALYLNLASASRALGEDKEAEANSRKALELSRKSLLPEYEWRALASLGKVHGAVEVVSKLSIIDAGAAPHEIIDQFGGLVEEEVQSKDESRAFNLAEKISELDRFNRMAVFYNNPGQGERNLYIKALPHLKKITAMNQKLQDSSKDEKEEIENDISMEEEIIHSILGNNDENLPEMMHFTHDRETRNKAMILMGLACKADQTANEYCLSNGLDSSIKEKYDNLIEEYNSLRQEYFYSRPGERAADILTLFGPEPYEAEDLFEILGKTILVRIFKASDYISFVVGNNQIKTRINHTMTEALASIPKKIAGRDVYIAYDEPAGLPANYPCGLSASFIARSFLNKKLFKRSLMVYPDDGSDKNNVQRADTLVLKPLMRKIYTIPVRDGDSAHPFLGFRDRFGKETRLEEFLGHADNLSLVLLSGVSSMEDAYSIFHLFSIFGCSSLIIPKGKVSEKSFVTSFLDFYRDEPGFSAKLQAKQGLHGWLFLGYRGMTKDEAKSMGKRYFIKAVKKGKKEFKKGSAVKALECFKEALWIAEEGRMFEKYIPVILEYARESAYKSGNYASAEKFAGRLVEKISIENPDSEKEAAALVKLGIIQAKREENEKAVANIEQGAKILKKLELDGIRAQAISSLGIVFENATRYGRALESYEESASVFSGMNKKSLLAAQYVNMGRLYDLRMSRYYLAEKQYKKAFELYDSMGAPLKKAQALLDLGRCHRLTGDFAAAEVKFSLALESVKQFKGDDPSLMAAITMEQADNKWFQADYEDAFRLSRKVYNMAVENEMPLMRIVSLNTIGLIWWTLGNNQKALSTFDQALKEAKSFHTRKDEIASTLNNKGLVLRSLGEYEKALDVFDKALAIDRKLKSKWAVAYDLRNKGLTLLRSGRPRESMPLFREALALTREISSTINQAKTLLSMGEAQAELGMKKEAETLFKSALELSSRMFLNETRWRALFGLAKLSSGHDRSIYENYLRKAIAVIEKMQAKIKITRLKESFVDNKLSVYQALVKLLTDQGRNGEAFEIAERSRARNFIDLLGNQQIRLNRKIDQKRYKRQAWIKMKINEVRRLFAVSQDMDEKKIYQREIDRLNGEYKDIMLEIQADNPQLSSFIEVAPITLTQLKRLLDSETALIGYYLIDDEALCWIIRGGPGPIELVRKKIKRKDLGIKILEYRRMIQNLEPFEEDSRQLGDLLLKDVLPNLKGIRYLGIIPHGSLHYLSFATLKAGGSYLIDKFSLFYLPSASILKYTMSRRQAKKNLKVLAIGNPDLGDPSLALPFAEQEVRSIKWDFPDVTMLTKEKATEDWVKDNIQNFGIIHMASHGEFDPINPLFSAIKLSKGKKGDGDLEAAEVFGLKINADMVVLSACQTGLGKVTAGDDLIGLSRSFFYAGTHTIISSLWRVSDVATAILVKDFYRRYRTHNKAESLRLAILHIKNIYHHPGYWGAFTLVGDYY